MIYRFVELINLRPENGTACFRADDARDGVHRDAEEDGVQVEDVQDERDDWRRWREQVPPGPS